jgi:hypothetical protein
VRYKRQLYYLLPDIKHTKEVCNDLTKWKIPGHSFHAVMDKKQEINEISDVHTLKETDYDEVVENIYWKLNIALFCLAFVVFVSMIIWQSGMFLFFPIVVMVVCITAGIYFILEIPHVHWKEFRNAIPHGEILLIIDVPIKLMHYVETIIHRRHPEVLAGGVCWKR